MITVVIVATRGAAIGMLEEVARSVVIVVIVAIVAIVMAAVTDAIAIGKTTVVGMEEAVEAAPTATLQDVKIAVTVGVAMATVEIVAAIVDHQQLTATLLLRPEAVPMTIVAKSYLLSTTVFDFETPNHENTTQLAL
jgi:hypothetical protein